MTAEKISRSERIMAWLVVVICIALIVLGITWYEFSTDVYQRIWKDISDRPGGPMTFRFLLQPIMAAIAATHDGIRDARLGRSPYFWTVLSDPAQRGERLREGLIATSRIILIGLGMDAIYQYAVLKTFYPSETVIIAIMLAFVPYLLLRGPIARIAQRWRAHNAANSTS